MEIGKKENTEVTYAYKYVWYIYSLSADVLTLNHVMTSANTMKAETKFLVNHTGDTDDVGYSRRHQS